MMVVIDLLYIVELSILQPSGISKLKINSISLSYYQKLQPNLHFKRIAKQACRHSEPPELNYEK